MEGGGELEAYLVRRVAAGDEEAFEALFRRFERPLLAYFLRVTGEAGAAEELVCETMVRVWRGAAGFRGESRASTWIFGIAHRCAAEAMRQRRAPSLSLEDARSLSTDPELEEAAERADLAGRVRAAVGALAPEHREVLQLVLERGFSYREVAEILGVPVNTVKTRMFYARQKLRALLEQQGVGRE